MDIRKLATQDEWLEADRLVATAFLHPWDDDEGAKEVAAQVAGEQPRPYETWGAFDDGGRMASAVQTLARKVAFGGEVVPIGEAHMVGSLPEARGSGNVRALMAAVLDDFRMRGDIFAVLIPFAFSFYRKFGFELATNVCEQRVPIDQLAGFPCDYKVTRVESEADLPAVRALWDAFALQRNCAEVRDDAAWRWRGNGDFGEPDFMLGDRTCYTYSLRDEEGTAHAYVRFVFTHEPNMPFVGELKVTEAVYDGPEAFLGILGFLYCMRAKVTHVVFELLDDIDLAALVPECDKVERKLGGHYMARILDVGRALELMGHPVGSGSYTLRVDDAFMPCNSGNYHVTYEGGKAQVEKVGGGIENTGTTGGSPDAAGVDLEVPQGVLCQLVLGRIGMGDALLRPGVLLNGNEDVLTKVFTRRTVCLR